MGRLREQFAVGWDDETQTVSILTRERYTPNGSEPELFDGEESVTITEREIVPE